MNNAGIFALFILLFGLKESRCSTPVSCETIDSLKLGCFTEKLSNREFSVSAGNYNTSLLKPEDCVRLCGHLSFPYAALQNGDMCLCGNSYGAYGVATSCNVQCSGDKSSICGGKQANTVYNCTVLTGHLSLNETTKPIQLFTETSIAAIYTNGTVSDPGLSIDISEDSGFSISKSISLPFTFIPTRWGKKKLTARNSFSGVLKSVISEVEVVSPVKYVEITCPNYVKVKTEFQCSVHVYQGTTIQATWRLGDKSGNISLADPAYLGVGPPVPQWLVPNITSQHPTGAFLLPSSIFTRDAMVLGLEIYGHATGNIKIFVARPICAVSSQQYCLNNATCILNVDKCTLDAKQQCPVSQLLNISSSECQNTTTCSSSFLHSAVYQPSHSSVSHSVVCDFGSISIKVGYNLFVIPENNTCKARKGDILGWVSEGAGLIGHQNGAERVRKYTISAAQMTKGYNFTTSALNQEISVEYLLRAVSAEGSIFRTSHVINQSGVVLYHVNATNNLSSLPAERSREVGVQNQVTSISVVYPAGFDYFGTRKNLPVEITWNISTATNVTVILKNSSSSAERIHTFVSNNNEGVLFFMHQANLSFPQEGVYELYAEAFNEISSINTTVRVLVGGEITGLNGTLSEPSKPVYQGLQTSLLATVHTGSLVRFKWILENNHSAVFVNSNETTHVFSKPGVANITLIASNQAFTVTKSFTILIVNPLSLSIPKWTPSNVSVTLNCSLQGNFTPNQQFAWDFGDGSNVSGMNANSVQHTFAKGGTHNITCRIDGPVDIHINSSIFVMEPLTGQCMKPFDGVELFDNKTFTAEYETGNNLTFSWMIQGQTTSALAVCSSNTFGFYFDSPGTYIIALNISNAISFLTCTRHFLVEEKISNLSIMATPNPAPSNTTVRFEISRKAGNNVTYSVNFSDGYFAQKSDDRRLEFNRTFSAGKRQVVLVAANTISEEIIFFNLTIQDVVKHLSINVDADGTDNGKLFVAVDKKKSLRGLAEQGTDLTFTWRINGEVFHDKGTTLSSGQVSVSRDQTFIKEGNVVVDVTAFNLVSNLSNSITLYAQKAIKDFDVIVPSIVAIGEEFQIRFNILEGGDVRYNVSFGDASGHIVTTKTSVMKSYFHKTDYTMRAIAFNQINEMILNKKISVRYRIKDLRCGTVDKVVALGNQMRFFWEISNGSDVRYFVNYGDGSPEVNLTSLLLGQPISLNYTYSRAKRYQVVIKASNTITQLSCNIEAIVQEPIRGLAIQSQGTLKVPIYEEVSISVTITHGSEVKYTFDFGDGSDPVSSDNGLAAHVYRYPGVFNPNITASNLLITSSVSALPFEASPPQKAKLIHGLKISGAPVKYGEDSKIKITWEGGALFECTLQFGDSSIPLELKYALLGPPVVHKYQSTGHFTLSIRCGNDLGAESATAIAKVEEPIEGLNFTSPDPFSKNEKAFGRSFEVRWTWLKGSFVTCYAEVSANGKILKSIQNLGKSINLLPEYFEKPGTFVITVRAINSVTEEQSISLSITLIQQIQNPQLLVNPYVQVNHPAMAFLRMQAGTHATSVWSYGKTGEIETLKSLSNNNYIRFEHRFSTSGMYVINVTVWNRFTSNLTVSSTVSILNPVVGFSINPRYTLQWPANSVSFQFKRNQTYQPPSNANYYFDFGDNSTSEKIQLDSSHSDFNFTYSYKQPGCYNATLYISNEASYVRLEASVSIIQKVETLIIEALHSDQSSSPGQQGRGKDRNILPLEYPVTFRARHLHGTCAKYKWHFGDNTQSKLETMATINHAYPLPGNYTVRVRVSNDISSKEYSSNIIILRSVVGLFLLSNSPVTPGKSVTFLIFCAQPGNKTEFVLETGENVNISVPFPTRGSGKEAMKNFSSDIQLPFDADSYYASSVQYIYKSNLKSSFDARVTAWNEVSLKSAQTTVVVTNLDCSIPNVDLYGGGKTLKTALPFKFDRGFRINSRVNFTCGDKAKALFQWSVFRADTYYVRNASMPPDEDRKISLPNHVIQNQSSITVPRHTLKPGCYLLQLTVTLSQVPLTNTAQQYVKISTPLVEAKIEGGSARSRGWEMEIILDASKSYDPLDSDVTLKYEWYCKQIKNAFIIGEGGCFGRGENLVESTESVFKIRARSLLESVEYEFSVTVTPEDRKRAVTTVQRITIVEGNPPDINIKCLYNCGGKMTSDERFAIEAYCTDCQNNTVLEYLWSAHKLVKGKNQEIKVWPDGTLTNQTLKFVVVKEKTFEQNATYVLKVQAKKKGGPSAFAEYKFTTNSPPTNGHCAITPEEGEELDTSFYVTCNAWVEEDTPLTYEILVKNNNNQTSSQYTLMWYGPELSDSKVILAAGEKENNYTLDLIVRVRDVYGAVNDTTFKIKVKPLSEKITSELLLGFVGDLDNNIARGDMMGAVQLTTVLGYIMNKQDQVAGSEMTFEEKKLVRSTMTTTMDGVILRDIQAVRQLSGSLELVAQKPTELSLKAQESSLSIYKRAVDVISNSVEDVEPAQIEIASQRSLSTMGSFIVAASETSEELFSSSSGNTDDLRKAQTVAQGLVDLTNTIANATLAKKLAKENETLYKTKYVQLAIKKMTSDDLGKADFSTGGNARFVLPGSEEMLGKNDDRPNEVGAVISEMAINPFSGTNSSRMVKSSAMSLVLMGENSQELKVEGVSSPIDIFLQNKVPQEEKELNTSTTPPKTKTLPMTVHKIVLQRPENAIIADIIPENKSATINVYFRFNLQPTLTEYDFLDTLPRYPVNESTNITSPGPYTIFASSDRTNGSGNYFIGVLPVDSHGNLTQEQLNYTFDVYSSGCYFWSEKQKIWTSEGCKVGNKTSRSMTHCQCTHLTWFGGDLFIPPNKLDLKKDILNLAELHKSPALLATVCLVASIYLLALVFARRSDKKDTAKVGLIAVPDNDPTDRFRYEVTVYTGRMGRSTTSNVSVILYGELAESHPITLIDKERPVFESGSVDSFFVTVPQALGPLNYIRIWHDNSGSWPAWYLNQVIIRDIDSDERFVFLCYRWFACDEDDGQVERIIPIAGKEELREFTYLFRNRAKKDFSDAHLWFSIALRPPRSRFTRVQRVSCCLCILLCTMLANVMWYDVPQRKNNTVIFESGFIRITWHAVVVGFYSSLIVFPINLLIAQIFRSLERRPKKPRKDEHEKTEVPKEFQKSVLKLNDIQTITKTDSTEYYNGKDFSSHKQKCFDPEDAYDDDLLCLLMENRLLDEHYLKHSTDSRIHTPLNMEPLDSYNGDIQQPFDQEDMRKKETISPVSECSLDFNDRSKLVKPTKPKHEPIAIKIPKPKFLLPWWFVFVGWFFCISTSLVAAFFTLLYGLKFKKNVQEEWLTAMFVSVVQDIFISQPLKVIGFALFFALILKKPDKSEESLNAELAKDEEWLKQNLNGRRRNALIAEQPKYMAPDEAMLKKARIRRFKERKMYSVIREIVMYALFVWVVLLTAYGHKDPDANSFNQGIENMLTGTGNSWLVDYKPKKPRNETSRKFLKVSGIEKFWNWSNNTLLASLYNGPWYNGKRDIDGYMADRTSWRIGVARLRQLRVKLDTCRVSNVFKGFLRDCNEPYSWQAEETTKQFKPGWLPAPSNFTTSNRAWQYRQSLELKSLPFLGRLAFYNGGGYAEDLGPTIKEARKKIKELKAHNWIDKQTRAVFVEMTIYNPHTNMHCVAFLILEVSASGGAFPFVELLVTRIDRYTGQFKLFVLIFELAFVAFTIFFTYKFFKGMLNIGPRYFFKEYWNWAELALISLSWTSIVLYFVRFSINTFTQREYRENSDKFVNFHPLAASDEVFAYIYAFVVFLVSLKFLRLFRFNRRMSLLASTLRNSSKELLCFSIVFGIVFMAFVHFCYLVFSKDLYMFHTVMSSVETLISVMLGKFSYERLLETNRVLAPLMFFFYSFLVVWVLVNMFISIIIENFQAVKHNNDLQSNEYEIVDFMTDQFRVWLGWSTWGFIFSSKNKVRDYPMGKPKYKKRKKAMQAENLKNRVDRLVQMIQVVYFEKDDFLRNDGEVTYQSNPIY